MYVAAQGKKVLIFLHEQRLIPAVEHMPCSKSAPVEPNRIGDKKVPHKFAEVSLISLDNNVKVVRHQDIGYNPYTIYLATIYQSFQEGDPIIFFNENILAIVASIHYMIESTGVLYPK